MNPLPNSPASPPRAASAADLRLRRHADFQRVYKASRKQFAREMSFFFALRPAAGVEAAPAPSVPEAGPRVGLTVGRVMGKAVDRNRIKRRLRQAVRLHAPMLADLPVDVVLHPRRTVLSCDWDHLERDVAQVFRTVRKLAAASTPKAAAAVR